MPTTKSVKTVRMNASRRVAVFDENGRRSMIHCPKRQVVAIPAELADRFLEEKSASPAAKGIAPTISTDPRPDVTAEEADAAK